MNYRKYLIICSLLFSSCGGSQEKNQIEIDNKILIETLDSICSSFENDGFVGVILIADTNEILLKKAYGPSNEMTTSTKFWIASNTKPITAMAILKLAEDKRLSLNDSLKSIFKNVPTDKENITIEQLLTHTSGLSNEFVCEGEQDREKAVNNIFSVELTAQPGREFHYTNNGYILLAAIIELTNNARYEDYIQHSIFEKTSMGQSNFWGRPDNLVDPIHDSAKVKPFYNKIFKDDIPFENWNNKGATGISSNVDDLYNLMIALREGLILNEETLQTLYTSGTQIDNTNDTIFSYGYGWSMLHTRGELIEIKHTGRGDWMHNNSMVLTASGYTVIVWSKDYGPGGKVWSKVINNEVIRLLNN